MSHITSCAVAPREDKESLSALFENADILLKNIEKIKADPENYYVKIQGTGITGVYIGSFALYLGDLLQLWNCGSSWIEKSAGETKYLYHLGGFPTSGRCFLRIYNAKTRAMESEERGGFTRYFKDALQLMKNDKNCRISVDDDRVLPISRPIGEISQSAKTLKDLLKEIK
ncbi:MAG: hypothetical protein IJI37_03235 [Opitutales bacterium]|nr:hypothetical protein [Opitutales bacterium]